jgi:hypothetical protein
MWGFAEAQEISGVSPAMHDEFVLQYKIPVLERFGLNCYGCCEPLHHKFAILAKVPRLRRISISPWCGRAMAAEALGDRAIYSWKRIPVSSPTSPSTPPPSAPISAKRSPSRVAASSRCP